MGFHGVMWRPTHPALIFNPRSGGGKAARLDLPGECRARGIELVELHHGDDLRGIAEDLVAGGADAIGVAGGDGSQALAATVAFQHDVPYICVPAGTRNHFALDVGIDRSDVIGALDAFARGTERRVDLARVNERIFVNNASLGVYAKIVQSEDYRNAKLETIAKTLPEFLPPRGEPFDVSFTAPDGERWQGPQLVLVSNDPYRFPRPGVPGNRLGVDRGVLGVIAVRVVSPDELVPLREMETTGTVPQRPGWLDFTPSAFTVDASAPIDVALDGEPFLLDPPLRFESVPGALRLRVCSSDRLGQRLRRASRRS